MKSIKMPLDIMNFYKSAYIETLIKLSIMIHNGCDYTELYQLDCALDTDELCEFLSHLDELGIIETYQGEAVWGLK